MLKYMLLIIYLFSIILNSNGSVIKNKKKVCIIGAGASGLTSARHLSEHPDEFDITIFEKNSDIGGVWIYTDSIDFDEHNLPVHTSMYKYLRTNLPKELMAFPEYRDFTGDERSCVTHETVLGYLKNYTDHFNLRQYIKFHTMVEKVTRIPKHCDHMPETWSVKAKNLLDNTISETTCDAVMVCNGHYFESRIPTIPGIENFPGKVMHSHIYRKPEDFTNQTVLILGASASGIDISIEVSEFADKVYLSHNKDRITSELPENIIQVPGVVSVENNKLILKNGSTVEADTLMFCTGYNFSYPFLDESSDVTVDDNHVIPLYKHLVNIEHPSMSFVGLPLLVVHFPLFSVQAHYFVSLLRGNVELPSKEIMKEDSNNLNGRKKKYAHFLGSAQWDYNDELAREGKFEPLPRLYKDGFKIWMEYRTANVLKYKESNLRIDDDGSIRLVHPHENKEDNNDIEDEKKESNDA